MKTEARPYRIVEGCYAPDGQMGRHAHDEAKITLVLRGQVREDVRGTESDGGVGDVVVKPTGAAHADWFGPTGLRTFSLRFPIDSAWHDLVNCAACTWHDGGSVVRAMVQALVHYRESGPGLPLDAAVCEVLAALPEDNDTPSGPTPPWVRRAREQLHDDPTLARVGDLASVCGVHPVHLTRQFRCTYGVTVSEYLQRLRARRAARRLPTEDPLALVAVDAGFADQAHMTRTFRRVYGVTPARYRALVALP